VEAGGKAVGVTTWMLLISPTQYSENLLAMAALLVFSRRALSITSSAMSLKLMIKLSVKPHLRNILASTSKKMKVLAWPRCSLS